MGVSMGDLEEMGAERAFLPGGAIFTRQRTCEAGPGRLVTAQRPLEHSTAPAEVVRNSPVPQLWPWCHEASPQRVLALRAGFSVTRTIPPPPLLKLIQSTQGGQGAQPVSWGGGGRGEGGRKDKRLSGSLCAGTMGPWEQVRCWVGRD